MVMELWMSSPPKDTALYSAPFPVSVVVGDMNGDGKLDLIGGSYSGTANVFLGNGNGTFLARVSYATGVNPTMLSAADLNGDGRLDIVTADAGGGSLSVLIGNGDGSHRTRISYATFAVPNSIATADVNGDGMLDLISSNITNTALSVLLGNGASQTAVAPTVGFYSLLTQRSSRDALTQFGQVLSSLTASLGQLGANQSRLQTVTNVLQQTRINYESAASQIVDVDVATEAANLAKNNILQQAGAAILAQANQQPALALRLLQGI
jgi:flagellin-like hook-associated protein FlgL